MSRPRPIHSLHRDLRSNPDETEPSYSYENESFLGSRELDVEDEFHRRLALNRPTSTGGGSFWRSTSTEAGPSFNSVNFAEKKRAVGGGGIAAALQTYTTASSSSQQEMIGESSPAASDRVLNSSFTSPDSDFGRRDSSGSLGRDKKLVTKQRAADRRRKLEAQSSDIDAGHIIAAAAAAAEDSASAITPPSNGFGEISHVGSMDRSSSDQSTGSLFYGKTPNAGTVLGKASSLIFPTEVETSHHVTDSESDQAKRRKINLLLDQCESIRFPFKKKLMLTDMGLTAADIPLTDLCNTSLGNSLHKLSLAGNRLGTVPAGLVVSLPVLKHLDLSQCELHQLPEKWNLPKLGRLNLSHNRLTDFPEESMLEGLPELHELNMYGNKVAEIVVPNNSKLLGKLETLNLGYNDLAYLPDELDQLTALRNLKVMNNFLEKVPMRVCEMDLRVIDVSSNPVIQPPIETCERGICSMKRYYHCLRLEEQSKQKALEEVQRKSLKQKKKDSKKKGYGDFIKSALLTSKPATSKRRSSDDNQASVASSASSFMTTASSLDTSRTKPATPSSLPKELTFSEGSGPMTASILKAELQRSGSAGKKHNRSMSDDFASETLQAVDENLQLPVPDQVTVNDTLKVIFVGMAMVGKTSMIKRLIEGRDAIIPTHDERTIGVDIYEWDPKKDRRFMDIDSKIVIQDEELSQMCGDVDVKFSVWDFAGQHVYHATHELFFSSRALYVLVWDMGATNRETHRRKPSVAEETGAFKLTYDSSDDEEEEEDVEGAFAAEEEARRADRALERDIDEKVQFWVDCIQSSAPGAAILPVASFSDYFDRDGGETEAKRRCNMLKQRLLKHEERRIRGIKERLRELAERKRADDPAAARLRKLLCPYTRPKLIFGDDDENSVVRVSGTQYTGFYELTSKIISLATGKEKGKWRYPFFHGHVGARIPRMRLEVRDAVRTMRDRFKVVEWGFFISQLRDRGLTNVEDISDALFFLTNIGELSYFGGVMGSTKESASPLENRRRSSIAKDALDRMLDDGDDGESKRIDDDDDDVEDPPTILSIDDTSITAPSTADDTLSSLDDLGSGGLSQFVFLNPRWLVAAVACILRHDLDREIKETRRQAEASLGALRQLSHGSSFYDADATLNCPVITADDACLLWQAKRITKKAAERAQEYSNNMVMTPFEFLQLLLIRFGVFVPIDLSIEKAFLGGREYAHLVEGMAQHQNGEDAQVTAPAEIDVEGPVDESAKFFFLPSLLGPCEPSDAWTYKSSDSWKTTICHSVLFPDGVPPGLMERLTAFVLSSIHSMAHREVTDSRNLRVTSFDGQLTVKELFCWRTAFYLKLGTKTVTSDGTHKESIVEIFCHLADRESHLCVGSDYMGVGMRRLIVSGRGQVGDGGRKIWDGGYLLVCKCIRRVMDNYGGLEFERHGFCPECLAKKAVSEASCWELSSIRAAVMNAEPSVRCQHGHRVDIRLVAGPIDTVQRNKAEPFAREDPSAPVDTVVPVRSLLRAVVVVGLWDGEAQKVVRVGSGFIADRKRGLIVTASHTLMNIWGDKNHPYGDNYYGLRKGKVVIGVIPEDSGSTGKDMAVFRYFAKIVAKDPKLDDGECHLDACVLKITTRMEKDVGGDGSGCGDQPEILLLNNPRALKNEGLQSLKITEKCEIEEQVRILGYNQGGEGLLEPGVSLNRYVDFARGYVCKRWGEDTATGKLKDRFKPRQEIVVMCPTIGGHSGGPCVNQQGEVIGILSRADPAEPQRCYIAPTSEWKDLLKRVAKNAL